MEAGQKQVKKYEKKDRTNLIHIMTSFENILPNHANVIQILLEKQITSMIILYLITRPTDNKPTSENQHPSARSKQQ